MSDRHTIMFIEATLIFSFLFTAAPTVEDQLIGEPVYTPPLPLQTLTTEEHVTEFTLESPNIVEDPAILAKEKAEAEAKALAEEEAKKAAEAKAQAEAAQKQAFTPPNVTPDPGSAQEEAYNQVIARGWDQEEFNCLVALWHKESGWRVNAMNASSGAYGIPQSLPGNKMAAAGADWETNPATQISWGLGYIQGRYQTPCNAWAFSGINNWY